MKEIENLYLLYKDDIYRYLLSLTHHPLHAEDLLSETFVRAITSIENFKGHSSIKTWLCSIARNLWLQDLRTKKNLVEYNDLLGLYVGDSISENMITKEIATRIKNLLKEKDIRTQKIVQMRIEGYSFSEIAQRVNINENSARVIDFRTKKWIRNILEKEGFR
ncbi:RNA polymerase sigma factor [Irregularibacter muris]|uniref:RNA polymerase sigma factor n=1 Tax=Irregularibacter muris TaxID=1796619 RepID=A0AAE3L329_9FIRM|nr:RNA polymerase sigma factor [Irregularibacter muris]MCR1897543.1 RNA polymerase sigma factor [Irregularibacter muris]